MSEKNAYVRQVADKKYEYGFTTDVHTDIIEKGLSEDVIRLISQKKNEPEWLLDFRLKSYRHWITLKAPKWAHLNIPEIDYQFFKIRLTCFYISDIFFSLYSFIIFIFYKPIIITIIIYYYIIRP